MTFASKNEVPIADSSFRDKCFIDSDSSIFAFKKLLLFVLLFVTKSSKSFYTFWLQVMKFYAKIMNHNFLQKQK